MNLSLWKKSGGNGELARLRDEMDRVFERFLADPFELGPIEPKAMRSGDWMPALDVRETDGEVTVRAEIPGVPAKDVEVSVSGTTLTITGKKEDVTEKKGENFYRSERRFGSFRRVVDLPDTIDADKVTAESDNGVVTIRVAKKPGAKARQIEVKPAAKKVAVSS